MNPLDWADSGYKTCPFCGARSANGHSDPCRTPSNQNVAITPDEAILITAVKNDARANFDDLSDLINRSPYGAIKATKRWVFALRDALFDV